MAMLIIRFVVEILPGHVITTRSGITHRLTQ